MKDRQVVTRVADFITEVVKVGEWFIKYNDLQMSGAHEGRNLSYHWKQVLFQKAFFFFNIFFLLSFFLLMLKCCLTRAISGAQSGPCSLPQTGAGQMVKF